MLYLLIKFKKGVIFFMKKVFSSILSGILLLWSTIGAFASGVIDSPNIFDDLQKARVGVTKTVVTNVVKLNGVRTRLKSVIYLEYVGDELTYIMAEPKILSQFGVSSSKSLNLLSLTNKLQVTYDFQHKILSIETIKSQKVLSSTIKPQKVTSSTIKPTATKSVVTKTPHPKPSLQPTKRPFYTSTPIYQPAFETTPSPTTTVIPASSTPTAVKVTITPGTTIIVVTPIVSGTPSSNPIPSSNGTTPSLTPTPNTPAPTPNTPAPTPNTPTPTPNTPTPTPNTPTPTPNTPTPTPTIDTNVIIYYETSDLSTIYYSVDNKSWSSSGLAMSKSEIPGYTKTTVSSKGQLWASFLVGTQQDNNHDLNYSLTPGTWTISKGVATKGAPATTQTEFLFTIYYKSNASTLYYTLDGQHWSAGDKMSTSEFNGYTKVVLSSTISSIKTSFVDEKGNQDNNHDLNYSLTPGICTIADGIMKSDKPVIAQTLQDITIYYRSMSSSVFHFTSDGTNWNVGDAMSSSEFTGYQKITVKSPGDITANFTVGTSNDNNNGKNYVLKPGINTIDFGSISSGSPNITVYYKSTGSTKMYYSVGAEQWVESPVFIKSDITGYNMMSFKSSKAMIASFVSDGNVDNNKDANYSLTDGILTIEDGVLKSGKPKASTLVNVRLYYKSTATTSVFYSTNGTTWSDATLMSNSTITGYKTLVIPTSSKIIASFISGTDVDNNFDKNYEFTAPTSGGTFTIENGKIISGDPNQLAVVTPSIKLYYKSAAATSMYYSVDGGAWTSSANSLTKSSIAGYYEISIKASSKIQASFISNGDVDNNSDKNYEFSSTTGGSFVIDNGKVTSGEPSTTTVTVPTVKIYYKSSAATTMYYSVDGGTWTKSATSLTKSTSSGYYEISIKASSKIEACFIVNGDVDNNNDKNYTFTVGTTDKSYTVNGDTNTVTSGNPK